jgi:hypothetical protein
MNPVILKWRYTSWHKTRIVRRRCVGLLHFRIVLRYAVLTETNGYNALTKYRDRQIGTRNQGEPLKRGHWAAKSGCECVDSAAITPRQHYATCHMPHAVACFILPHFDAYNNVQHNVASHETVYTKASDLFDSVRCYLSICY